MGGVGGKTSERLEEPVNRNIKKGRHRRCCLFLRGESSERRNLRLAFDMQTFPIECTCTDGVPWEVI